MIATLLTLRLCQFQDGKTKCTTSYHKTIIVGLNEDSVRTRKGRVKSGSPMQTINRIHVITNITVENMVPDNKYDDYHGSTRNDLLSLVSLPAYDIKWNLPLTCKIAVYSHPDLNRRVVTTDCNNKLMSNIRNYNDLKILLHHNVELGPCCSR